ncbi:MAG: TonB-dependent receptor [Marinilabiliaceae bacterium]|nr:TonB-dependent receptor [Marinilabiliaceae bacterium]
MKISLVLLIVCGLSLAASVVSQEKQVDLSIKNATLLDVFEQIKKSTGYGFIFKDDQIDLSKTYSFDVKDGNINEVLMQLLDKDDYRYAIIENNVVITKIEKTTAGASSEIQQQLITITGKVSDKFGEPVPGVNVYEKNNAQHGVITGIDGTYTLQVDEPDDIIVFSFIGFVNQEIQIAGRSSIDITLVDESIGLDEVVAIGYGSAKKSDLTGAVVKADIESFKEQPNASIVQSLQGTVPGLNISQATKSGENPSILIRGQNSLSGSNAPLIVLDGAVYRGSLVEINPNDIASVDILKDASSTAIYGSQAANGVIIITTKRGKKEEKPIFSYAGSYSIQTFSNMLTPLDRDGYIQKQADRYWRESRTGPDYTTPNPDFDVSTKIFPDYYDGYQDGETNTDWLDLISKDGSIQSHNLSMSGATEKTNYFISTGYYDQEGFVIDDKYKRYSLRMNFENNITDWFTLGVQSFITSADYSGASPSLLWGFLQSPLGKSHDEDGNLEDLIAGQPNPLLSHVKVKDLDTRMNLFGNFYAEVKLPVDGLKYRFNYSQNYRSSKEFRFDERGESWTGSAYKKNGSSLDWSLDNILSYEKKFNSIHDINATLLYGVEEREGEKTEASSGVFPNLDLGYNWLEGGDVEKHRVNSSKWSESSLYMMGRLQYKFNDRYLATATVRRDGFSGFGENTKIGVFPSVALGWVLSEEGFIKDNISWIDFLKLRGSYGESGNRTIGRYGTLAQMSTGNVYVFGDGGSSVMGQTISNLSNKDLGWETTTGTNLGLDFNFLNSRIRGNIEYYNTSTTGMLFKIELPRITGYSDVFTNIGEVSNHGIEFTLSTTNVKIHNFTWESSFNFSRNRSELVKILGQDLDGDGKEDDQIGSKLFIGESLHPIYDYTVDGMWQIGDDLAPGFFEGTYRIANLNGDKDENGYDIISAEDDRSIIGHKDPSYRFSFQNNFKYKNWSLMVFLNSIQGGKNYYYGSNSPNNNGYWRDDKWNVVEEYDYWTPENTNATYPSLDNQSKVRPNYYQQRNFVRLKDVTLSYSFDKSILNKLGVRNLTLSVSAKNLYTWTKWTGVDPETGAEMAPNAGNPVPKTFSFGANFSF